MGKVKLISHYSSKKLSYRQVKIQTQQNNKACDLTYTLVWLSNSMYQSKIVGSGPAIANLMISYKLKKQKVRFLIAKKWAVYEI